MPSRNLPSLLEAHLGKLIAAAIAIVAVVAFLYRDVNPLYDIVALVATTIDVLVVIPQTRILLWCAWIFLRLPVREQEKVAGSCYYYPPGETPTRGGRRRRFRPLYVPKEFLERRGFWKLFGGKWAYNLLVLDNELTLTKETEKITLGVDLRGISHGVYSSDGRQFVLERLTNKANADDIANKFQMWMEKPSGKESISLAGAPLVWSAGGALPIVNLEGKDWCLLYLRNHVPEGISIPVGGSEDADELLNLQHLCVREFAEETIIVTSKPERGRSIEQLTLDFGGFIAAAIKGSKLAKRLLGLEFTGEYAKKRKAEGVSLVPSKSSKMRVKAFDTPFQIIIQYEGGQSSPIENVIFSISPLDASIDCYLVVHFEIGSNYMLHGEVSEQGFPLRSPIVLFSLEYLRKVYNGSGSLGTPTSKGLEQANDLYRGGKKIAARVPLDQFRILAGDADLVGERRQELTRRRCLRGPEQRELRYLSARPPHGYPFELIRQIKETKSAEIDAIGKVEPLFVLVGPTWGPLELAFRYGIFSAVPK